MPESIVPKTCPKCKGKKTTDVFGKNKNTKDGLNCWCKQCVLAATKAYALTDRGRQVRKNIKKRRIESGQSAKDHVRYRQTAKTQATEARYKASGHARRNALRYTRSEKGKTQQRLYYQTDEGKESRRRNYQASHKKYPEKWAARSAVCNAVRDGVLPKASDCDCHECDKAAQQYHHRKGYAPEYWLDVVPLCRKCHIVADRIIHKAIHIHRVPS